MNLLCLSDFNQGGIVANKGDVCEFPMSVALRLLDSWPGCWEDKPELEGVTWAGYEMPKIETEAIDAPPADKMMRKAKAKRRG